MPTTLVHAWVNMKQYLDILTNNNKTLLYIYKIPLKNISLSMRANNAFKYQMNSEVCLLVNVT